MNLYTLYYSPNASSLAVHCLLEELGVPFEAKRVSERPAVARAMAREGITPFS